VVSYKPLLPKWLLYLAYSVLGILVLVAGFVVDFTGNSIVSQLEFSSLFDKVSFDLPEFQVSSIVVYGILGFGVMLMLQLVLVKYQFDKRNAQYFG